MKRIGFSILALLLCLASRPDEGSRPRILGIARVNFYSTDLAPARDFYKTILNPQGTCLWCEGTPRTPLGIMLDLHQMLTLSAAQSTPPPNLLSEVDFAVEDLKKLRN